ncbi:MAG: TlpA family protein disulfide reductase [Acidobacteria bacterium]|nr:TlpA family protein disulfide reductase [Acidobacteriota bacterium]
MNRRLFTMALMLLIALSLAQAANIPRPAPEFVIHMNDDSQILLSQLRGKVVALEFLLTTCPHCKVASKVLTKLQNEWGPKGLQCVGVAIDPMPKLGLLGFVAETGATYPVGYSEYNTAVAFLEHPPLLRMLVPQVMIVDRNGIVRALRGGEDDEFYKNEEKVLRSIIEPLLNERAAPAARKSGSVKKPAAKKR